MTDAEMLVEASSSTQLKFIEDELQLDKEDILKMDSSDIDDLYDKICFIEVETTMEADQEGAYFSERGRMAEGIVTLWGDLLCSRDEDDISRE